MKFMELIGGDAVTLVDFYATWCGPCKAMHTILEDYKKQVGGSVRVVKLDIDLPANTALVREYRVASVPTLMFFRRGDLKWRGSGVMSVAQLREISDKL